MSLDLSKYQALAAQQGPNMTEATEGGGDYTPPAEGVCRLRFIAYVEVGKHTSNYQGQEKQADKVQLVFELSGPKHQPYEIDGEKVPYRITVYENAGRNYGALNEKANLYKLFKAMNYDGTATHFAQLLGREYLGTVKHKKKGDRVVAELRGDNGYTIRPPVFEDPETGESRKVAVDPAISPLRLFLWNFADLEQWSSLFIDGERNPFQKTIRQADNFVGSPIQIALLEAGLDATPTTKANAAPAASGAVSGASAPAGDPPFEPGKASDDVLNAV